VTVASWRMRMRTFSVLFLLVYKKNLSSANSVAVNHLTFPKAVHRGSSHIRPWTKSNEV
jgi:hypothetical protein